MRLPSTEIRPPFVSTAPLLCQTVGACFVIFADPRWDFTLLNKRITKIRAFFGCLPTGQRK